MLSDIQIIGNIVLFPWCCYCGRLKECHQMLWYKLPPPLMLSLMLGTLASQLQKFCPEKHCGCAQQDLPTRSKCLCARRTQNIPFPTQHPEHGARRPHLPGALEIFNIKMI